MKTKSMLSALGLVLTAACGGVEAPEATTQTAALTADVFDVDVAGEAATLYARVEAAGQADYALQLDSGEWIEGVAQVVRPDGEALDEDLAKDFAQHLYAQLTTPGETAGTRQAPAGLGFSYIISGAEPHKPVGAEPHRDDGDDADAEPHAPKPRAEPHMPVLASAEPH